MTSTQATIQTIIENLKKNNLRLSFIKKQEDDYKEGHKAEVEALKLRNSQLSNILDEVDKLIYKMIDEMDVITTDFVSQPGGSLIWK